MVPHITGKSNPAHMLSKHCDCDMPSVSSILKPMLFWHSDILEEEDMKDTEVT